MTKSVMCYLTFLFVMLNLGLGNVTALRLVGPDVVAVVGVVCLTNFLIGMLCGALVVLGIMLEGDRR